LIGFSAEEPPLVRRGISDRSCILARLLWGVADVEPEQHEADAGRDHE